MKLLEVSCKLAPSFEEDDERECERSALEDVDLWVFAGGMVMELEQQTATPASTLGHCPLPLLVTSKQLCAYLFHLLHYYNP